jgi:hypothetical protein
MSLEEKTRLLILFPPRINTHTNDKSNLAERFRGATQRTKFSEKLVIPVK